jgi:hypothetical protein
MIRIFNIISFITLTMAFLLISVAIYWLVYPYRVLEIKGSVFPILNENKTIKRGHVLYFESDNCKFMNITATTSRTFVDTLNYYIPMTITNVRKGCGKVTISVPVSELLPPGKYYLHNIFQYKVNPLRTITVEHDTEYFTIIE